MTRSSPGIPRWIWLLASAIVIAQAAAVALRATDALQGPARNLVPQILIGGLVGLVLLATFVFARHEQSLRPPPTGMAIILLTVIAVGLVGLHFVRIRPFLVLPYDLACWSEPMFVLDILKLRTGTEFYLAPEASNSNVYMPTAPVVTYGLAWVLGQPTSIVAYRWIQQFFLLLTALLAALSAWNLLQLADPDRAQKPTRLWLPLFAAISFLLAVNPETNAFNIYLHNDPFALLVSTTAFWTLTQYARTQRPSWLWTLVAIAPMAFLVKQYLAIWAVAFLLYLWLTDSVPLRRIIWLGAAMFGGFFALVLAGRLLWGEPFRYWVFEVMGSHILSFEQITGRFADAAWLVALGTLGGWVLLREPSRKALLAIWVGWLVLVLGAVYTSGITFRPTHYGPATMVGGCFALAALARTWSGQESSAGSPASQWLRVFAGFILVLTILAGLGLTQNPEWRVSRDVERYVQEIEREFEGLPPESVLLDTGEWFYLRQTLVQKDRATSLLTHREPRFGLLDRIRKKQYARILAHHMRNDRFLYDLGMERGIGKTILENYREVRRIPAVRDTSWEYAIHTLGEISVFEPMADRQEPNRAVAVPPK